MAKCLHPIWIKIDRRGSNPLRYQHSYLTEEREGCVCEVKRKYVRESLLDYAPIPCGKCINCLKNKQNAMVSRCLAESDKRGSFTFVTLTYSNENMPVAQSLWRASKVTGECELVSPGEVVSSSRDKLFRKDDREKLIRMVASPQPRYLDKNIDGFEDDEYVYFSRLTPSLYRKDFQLWLKRCRVTYERVNGKKLDFSYVCVGEMGPQTCRPHYHIAFFGLSRDQVEFFVSRWNLGYTNTKHVNSINPDGTDGFAIASRYIGKYMSKGKFDCASVMDKSAVKPRVCQSKGIGRNLIDWVKSRVYCFDMFGQYDIDTFFCPSLNRPLSQSEIDSIVREVPNRLSYDSSYGFKLPIPRLFRDDLFYHKSVTYVTKRKQDTKGNWVSCRTPKIIRKSTTLWSLVTAYLREHVSADDSRKFFAFMRRYSEGQTAVACNAFTDFQNACNEISEASREANYKQFLNSAKDGQ